MQIVRVNEATGQIELVYGGVVVASLNPDQASVLYEELGAALDIKPPEETLPEVPPGQGGKISDKEPESKEEEAKREEVAGPGGE